MLYIEDEHKPLKVVMNARGQVKEVTGNVNCWYRIEKILYNLQTFIAQGWKPDLRMCRHWNRRDKTFGVKNLSEAKINKATVAIH